MRNSTLGKEGQFRNLQKYLRFMAVLRERGASTGPRSNSYSTKLSKNRDIEERKRGKREKVEGKEENGRKVTCEGVICVQY